jgi:hypothetical protein
MEKTMALLARVIGGVTGLVLFGTAVTLFRVESTLIGVVALTVSGVIGAVAAEHVLKWVKRSQRDGH